MLSSAVDAFSLSPKAFWTCFSFFSFFLPFYQVRYPPATLAVRSSCELHWHCSTGIPMAIHWLWLVSMLSIPLWAYRSRNHAIAAGAIIMVVKWMKVVMVIGSGNLRPKGTGRPLRVIIRSASFNSRMKVEEPKRIRRRRRRRRRRKKQRWTIISVWHIVIVIFLLSWRWHDVRQFEYCPLSLSLSLIHYGIICVGPLKRP